jgi:hypothetical protein
MPPRAFPIVGAINQGTEKTVIFSPVKLIFTMLVRQIPVAEKESKLMIVAIFTLAAMLILAAVAGLLGAISLVPTDLGFTYMQASSLLFGTGSIVLAIGFATRALDRRLAALVLPQATTGQAGASPGRASAMPGQDDSREPDLLPTLPVVAGAAGLGAGAIVAAGASMAASPLDGPVAERLTDELERDLFSEIEAGAPSVVATAPASGDSAVVETVSVSTRPETIPVPPPDLPLIADMDDSFDKTTRPEPVTATGTAAPAGPVASEAAAKIGEPVRSTSTKWDTTAPKDESVSADTSADVAESAAQTLPKPVTARFGSHSPDTRSSGSAPAGLVADDDLAAMEQASQPPLAPLSSLDEVGSYDSGGTRFTMYSDGSVVASGPQGEQRFRSLEELRRHIGPG